MDLNATQAALRAGCSEKTARSIGSVNLTKPDIQEAITKAKAERSERTKIDADWVLIRLAALEDVSVADFLNTLGEGMPFFDLSAATPEQLAAIEGLQLSTRRVPGEDGGTIEKIKLTLPGKLKTLELIGKHLDVQAFSDRKKIGGIGGGPVQVEDMTATEAARRILFALRLAVEEKEQGVTA